MTYVGEHENAILEMASVVVGFRDGPVGVDDPASVRPLEVHLHIDVIESQPHRIIVTYGVGRKEGRKCFI